MAPSQQAPETPQPLTDSPWFWFFVFGVAGLVALLVIGPKHFRRQERLVRMQQARDASDAYRGQQDYVPPDDQAEPGDTATVRMLAAFLLVVLLGVGQVLLLRRRRSLRQAMAPPLEPGGRT